MKHAVFRKIELCIIAVLVIFALLLSYRSASKTNDAAVDTVNVHIRDVMVRAEVADTAELRQRGLSGRESMDAAEGMLFLFDKPSIQHFWMNDMQFPLDVIWIQNGAVTGFTEHVPIPQGGSIPRMDSEVPVEWVLEVNAGFVEEHGIKIGDTVDLDSKF